MTKIRKVIAELDVEGDNKKDRDCLNCELRLYFECDFNYILISYRVVWLGVLIRERVFSFTLQA